MVRESRLATAEANVNGDPLGLDERHILDQQRHDALALDRRGARIVPDAAEVFCEGEDAPARLLAEQPLIGGTLALVFALQRIQMPEPVVPVGFQRVGDETIIRVDLEITAPRELSLITGPLQLRAAQALGLLDAMGDLLLHREGHLNRRRRHTL